MGLRAGKWIIEGKWLSCPLSYEDGASVQPYEIHLSRIETADHVLAWIAHLSEKVWADRYVLRDFTLTTMKHLNVRREVPAGKP